MIPELGHLLLYFALGTALVMGVLPLAGAQRQRSALRVVPNGTPID